MKKDLWPRPFRKMVTLGESHTAGISATSRELGWAPVLKSFIDRFQKRPVALVNQGIGADILSTSSPMYRYYRGWRPIGLERYGRHVIDEKPDLVIVSYGYNDLRSGTPVAAFERDLHRMLSDLKRRVRGVIVLLDTYFITAGGYRNRRGGTEAGVAWNRGSPRIQASFNRVLRRAATKFDLLFAEVSAAQGGAEWLICSPDGRGDAHANDLGHHLIAQKIFEVLASNCRGLSLKAQEDRRRTGKSPWRYEPYAPGADCTWEEKLIRDFFPNSRMDRNQRVSGAGTT